MSNMEGTVPAPEAGFASNEEYLASYVDMIYLRAVVGGMISFAEQTSFQDLLGSKQRSSDYNDYALLVYVIHFYGL